MQRYLASELPTQASNRPRQQPHGGRSESLPQPVQHAVQLGVYVMEQRGREGVAMYVQGLQRVLSDAMLEPICKYLQVPKPQPVQTEHTAEEGKPQQPKPCREPDMEKILKLMQMMRGKDAPDLSALMQFMGGAGKNP